MTAKLKLTGLSVAGGLILSAAWPENGLAFLAFAGFVPFLWIEDRVYRQPDDFGKYAVFFLTYPGFFIWNFATSWWIWNSTPVGVLAWVLNAMFMSIVFQAFHWVRRQIYYRGGGLFILPVLWIAFEYLHTHWKLTWPWLNVGHVFSARIRWIQWYEFTGTLGGTLWVLLVNILLFQLIRKVSETRRPDYVKIVTLVVTLFVPLFISIKIFNSYTEEVRPFEVVVTQPNLDPYSEQYDLPPVEVAERNLKLADSLLTPSTRLIASPESALQEAIWESHTEWSPSLKHIVSFLLNNRPDLQVIIGASTFRRIGETEPIPSSARYHEKGGFWYDRFNTAFLVDTTLTFMRHHKSKLTPGVEYMPSWGPLRFLENLALDLGGTVGSLGTDPDPRPFVTYDGTKLAPLICYESVYGDYVSEFVRKGAEMLVVITNDGWWGNTPGHRQHLLFSSLRAIETRRPVARSANTGISCFVNQKGEISQRTPYWVKTAIRGTVNLNDRLTFYTRWGDYLGRVASFLTVMLLLISFANQLRGKKKLLR
ncbi:MAG: apolipoprotein N-acyltransferase [Bacteroidales bacterium]